MPTLSELIQEFITVAHPEMADQKMAWAMCDYISDRFVRFAKSRGYEGLRTYTFTCSPRQGGLFVEPRHEPRHGDKPNPAPELYDTWEPDGRVKRNESGAMMCTWHCVVDAGMVLIDFTARQYSTSYAFPTIIPIGERAFAAGAGC